MDTVRVVIESPAVNHPACFLEASEDFPIQQFVAKHAVEQLDLAVLPKTALGDNERFQIGFA